MPAYVLAQVTSTLHIDKENSYHVHLGTDRPNIAWFTRKMAGGKKDLESLNFLIPTPPAADQPAGTIHLARTLVLFDEINVAIDALQHLRARLPDNAKHWIQVYHSRRSRRAKAKLLACFRKGNIKILLSTEAAGMGCDIPDIEQVVQFMVPASLSIWMQRAGRAGRDPSIMARAVLLVQPSVFQEVKSGSKGGKAKVRRVDEEEVVYRKDIEPGLRAWIETKNCRRVEAARYFDDEGERHAPSGICCDNCLQTSPSTGILPPSPTMSVSAGQAMSNYQQKLVYPYGAGTLPSDVPIPTLTPQSVEASVDGTFAHSDCEDDSIITESTSRLNANGKRALKVVPNRREGHLQDARSFLIQWRYTTWSNHHSQQPWGTLAFMPNKVLYNIASHTRSCTPGDLIKDGWSLVHAHRYSVDLIAALHDFDIAWRKKHEQDKLARREAQKRDTAKRNADKAATKAAQHTAAREARQSQSTTPRPSRAKKAAHTPNIQQTRPALVPIESSSVVVAPTASSPNPGSENVPPGQTLPHGRWAPTCYQPPSTPRPPYFRGTLATPVLSSPDVLPYTSSSQPQSYMSRFPPFLPYTFYTYRPPL